MNNLIKSRQDIYYFIAIIVLIISLLISSIFSGRNNFLKNIFKENNFHYYYSMAKDISLGNKIYINNEYENQIKTNNFKIVYSPVFYYFYLPLTLFSESSAFFLSSFIFIILYILAIIFLLMTFKRLRKYKFAIIFFSLLFPPFLITLFSGNPAILWFLLLASAFYMSKREKFFISGLILSIFCMHPIFFILLLIITLFSFRPKLFLGFICGSIIIIMLVGFWDKFTSWIDWGQTSLYFLKSFINFDMLENSRNFANQIFFYPVSSFNSIIAFIDYILVILGILSILAPIIYSFFYKKQFSRNSFWLIFTISLVLANSYIFDFELIILLLPILIFINLMLADRVINKYMIIIISGLCLSFIICDVLSIFIHVQLFIILLWFILINGVLGKRVRNFTPKTFITYWEDDYN